MTNKILAGLMLTAGLGSAWAATAPQAAPTLEERVRKALVTIPYVSVFDDLSYRVENGTVTLSGAVTRPIVKDYAEKAVQRVEGITAVNDQIEVLPLSAFDDDIRLRTLGSLSRTASLYRYFMGTNPSIRIVVKNGRVTLDGVVLNSMDRQLAFMAANRVSGVFAVTNDLRTER
jgi:hyperosmotically inducible protein